MIKNKLSMLLLLSMITRGGGVHASEPLLNDAILDGVDGGQVADVTRGCSPCADNLLFQKVYALQQQVNALQACCNTPTGAKSYGYFYNIKEYDLYQGNGAPYNFPLTIADPNVTNLDFTSDTVTIKTAGTYLIIATIYSLDLDAGTNIPAFFSIAINNSPINIAYPISDVTTDSPLISTPSSVLHSIQTLSPNDTINVVSPDMTTNQDIILSEITTTGTSLIPVPNVSLLVIQIA